MPFLNLEKHFKIIEKREVDIRPCVGATSEAIDTSVVPALEHSFLLSHFDLYSF